MEDLTNRRTFLSATLSAASLAAIGCSTDSRGTPDGGSPADQATVDQQPLIEDGTPTCIDPFAGGTKLSDVPFVNEGKVTLDQPFNQGLDGRLYHDLSQLTSGSLITPNDTFFIRTRFPDQLTDTASWSFGVRGLVKQQQDLKLKDLLGLIESQGTVLLECSGNSKGGNFGLLSAATWDGISMDKLLAKIPLDKQATRVLVSGFDKHSAPSANNHSTPGASWVFTLDQLSSHGAFLATRMNGVPLPKDHGLPARLVVPRWYGCCCIKWVDEIRLMDDTAAATTQMKEFASRTHQQGAPALAKDYLPAVIGQAAMPVRVEKWQLAGKIRYRVVGVMWGGDKLTDRLMIRFNPSEPYRKVDVCPTATTNKTWTLWVHSWEPASTGTHEIRLAVDDPSIVTVRLDSGYYRREVSIDQV